MKKLYAGMMFGMCILAVGVKVHAAPMTGHQTDIKYFKVESTKLSTGDTQQVRVGLDNDVSADEASIEVYNSTIDQKNTYFATEKSSGELVFNFEIPEEGDYSITGIDVKENNQNYEYSLKDTGYTTQFSADTNDAQIYYEEKDNTYKAGKTLVVVIDAGHGGYDGGTQATYNGVTYSEKNLNLKIALACRDELQKYYGVEVYMTRSDDTFVKLEDRTAYARNVGADVFVSIHNNSSESSSPNGVTVFYPNANYSTSIGSTGKGLATSILNQLTPFGLKNNGVQTRYSNDEHYPDGSTADYYSVIRGSKNGGFPGLIVEHAYVSNQYDATHYLGSDGALKALGVADAKGIAQYYGLQYGQGELKKQDDGSWHYMHDGQTDTSFNDLLYYQGYWYVISNGVLNRNYTGLYKYRGNWYYVKDGVVDFHYTGLASNSSGWFYVENGSINWKFTGMCKGEKGWFYVKKGKVDFSKNGLIQYGGNWFFVKNGYLDWKTNTLIRYNGRWYGIHNGMIDWNYSGILRLGGSWYYVENGKLDWSYTGLAKGEKGWFYIKNGKVDFSRNGLVYQSGNWFYIQNGYLDWNTTTLVKYRGTWYGVHKGMIDWSYSGIIRLGGSWYCVDNGKLNWNYTGLTKGDNGWYYIKDGKVDFSKTGLVYNAGNWFWITNGYLNWNSHGVIEYKGDWYCIRGGKIDWSYTGLARGVTGTWYIRNGMVDFSYSGSATLDGNEYVVSEGYATVKGTAIMGSGSTTVDQMVAYYNANAKYPDFYANTDAPTIRDFCQIYYDECAAEGVKAEVAFCQAMNETGFLKYGGQVDISQFNFAGIGSTDDGAAGATFENVRTGVRAQVQHLKAYATTDSLNGECVDPRFNLMTKSRGSAPIVEWLGIQENPAGKGWATAKNYGYTIRDGYMNKLAQY